jgi:multicomponent Na+:H+ antiporter subunit B
VNSLILSAAARFLFPLLLLFSIFLLLRGHNQPGGGFTGGLLASSAFALYWVAFDAATAQRALGLSPFRLIGAGLLLAIGSGWIGPLWGAPFLTGVWMKVTVPGLGAFDIGTPLFFDIGVYLLVIGMAMLIITSLAEETRE